jgi:hypothetical protein
MAVHALGISMAEPIGCSGCEITWPSEPTMIHQMFNFDPEPKGYEGFGMHLKVLMSGDFKRPG